MARHLDYMKQISPYSLSSNERLDRRLTKADFWLGAVRIEHQFYELGQACANACDIALAHLDARMSVQDVPYDILRARLLDQGAVLDVHSVGKPDFSLV